MKKSFSHLIWLGAGQAKEPTGLINQATKVTLIDARESACEYLKKQFPLDHVQVIPKLLTVHGGQQSFTEYNLPEYSALQAATGLKKLFPGLKIAHQETMASIPLEQFFKELNLTDNKNVLVADLPDINRAFLEALHKTGELYKFSKVYIFANPVPLYLDALNATDIINFLQSIGYLLQETVSTDPDFPCLVFGVNPLWVGLQQVNHLNAKLVNDAKELQTQQETLKQQLVESKQQADLVVKERESLKQQLANQQQQKESQDKERETLKQQLVELKQQVDLVAKERESLKQQLVNQQQQKETQDKERETLKQQLVELKQQLDLVVKERESLKQQLASQQQQKNEQDKEQEKLKQKLTEEQKKLTEANGLLEQATKQSASRKDTVGKLEKEKRELEEANKSLKLKQDLLEKELIKAEAQIDLIKILLVKA
jgi:hypothetical protein